jgi:hypothetical protein
MAEIHSDKLQKIIPINSQKLLILCREICANPTHFVSAFLCNISIKVAGNLCNISIKVTEKMWKFTERQKKIAESRRKG